MNSARTLIGAPTPYSTAPAQGRHRLHVVEVQPDLISVADYCRQALIQHLPSLAKTYTLRQPETAGFTEALTFEVDRVICMFGGQVARRVPLDLVRTTARGSTRQGMLGILGSFGDGSLLAVEVGRSNASRARDALAFAAQVEGASALWVRWRGKVKEEPSEGVALLDITRFGWRVRRMRRRSPLN